MRSHARVPLLLLVAWILYGVMWAGGIGTYAIAGGVRPQDAWAAPAFLALAGAVALGSAGRRFVVPLVAAAGAAFALEWVGLHGGWLFGPYRYTEVLGPAVGGVPLAIASAWMVLALWVHQLLRGRPWPAAVRVGTGAVLLTAADVVIDPLAAGPLGYWNWLAGGSFHGVPLQNFGGWFVTGTVVLAVLEWLAPREQSAPVAAVVGWSVVLFFTMLSCAYGYWVPAVTGAALAAGPVLLGLEALGSRRLRVAVADIERTEGRDP